ncbi:MAG: tetratricopeptide repeat protein [Bacteroidetes bacterium]|nr:tetratricopeptide repeat protein [Bacteroidota bacterium]
MKKLIASVCLLVLSVVASAKTDNNTLWSIANKHYAQKNYDSAVVYYEKITASHPQNAVVYYNLGNAYYKLNQITPAIINYETALKFDPSYSAAENNLLLAQSRIANRIPQGQDIFFVRWWKNITSQSKATTWAVLGLILFLSLIAVNMLKRLGKLSFRIPGQAFAGAWSLLAIILIFAFVSADRKTSRSKAVIIQADVPFYTSPQQSKPTLYIPEGTTVNISNNLQNWIEITLPDGRSGWIQANTITKI